MKKKYKYLIILPVIVLLIAAGYFLYNHFNNQNDEQNKQYVLEKFSEIDSKLDTNSKITSKNGIVFLETADDYLKIYNEKGENITPNEIDNKKIPIIDKVEKNNEFFGYTFAIENKGYYIDEKGKIVLNLESNTARSYEDYIDIRSDKLCYKPIPPYYGDEYCSMIYDLNGNLLLDGKKGEYYVTRVFYEKNDKPLFEVIKNSSHGIIDKENNIIIKIEYTQLDYIENRNIIIARKDKNLIDIYDTTGKLLKELNLNDIKKYEVNDKYSSTYAEYSVYLNDTIYLLDENYNLKEYNNVYHVDNGAMGMNGEHNINFYISDYIYIKENDGIYTIHNLKGEKIINEEFKFVGPSHPDGIGEIDVPNEYIPLCKDTSKKECGAIDYKGNILVDFENEIGYNNGYEGFKNNNQYFDILDGKVTKRLTCNNNQINSKISFVRYNKNTIVVEDENIEFSSGGRKLIDYNCNDLSEPKYHNIYEFENFIVAQHTDWTTYDVYDINGKLIDSKNIDKNKLTHFLGYNDGKLYFSHQNTIYVLKENK